MEHICYNIHSPRMHTESPARRSLPGQEHDMKLWKVTVNAWGWDQPRILYFRDKSVASIFAARFPASDPVVYAGKYTEAKAAAKLEYTESVLVPDMW